MLESVPPQPLLRFYRDGSADDQGRRLRDILAWDDDDLEGTHDYIQWLFPLPEPGAFNRQAPRLDPAQQAALQRDPLTQANIRRAFARMAAFYGYDLTEDHGIARLSPSPQRATRLAQWHAPGDHNLLRLTRILRSLRLLGHEDLAQALFDALTRLEATHPHRITPRTWHYWRNAMATPLTPGP